MYYVLFIPQLSATEQDAWVATWTASPEAADPNTREPVINLEDQTVRERMRVSLGGSQIRIRLSNEYGSSPLVVGSVTVAESNDVASVKSASMHAITFGGRTSIRIPAGAPALSDPVALPVTYGGEISVSVYFPELVSTPDVACAGTQAHRNFGARRPYS